MARSKDGRRRRGNPFPSVFAWGRESANGAWTASVRMGSSIAELLAAHGRRSSFLIESAVRRPLLGLLAVLSLLCMISAAVAQDSPEPKRDFPPLEGPHPTRPAPPDRIPTPEIPSPTTPGAPADTTSRYLIGAGDELTVTVIGQPELSRVVRVLPDGSITYPGVEGTLFVMGKTADAAGLELKEKLGRILRYPDLQLMITAFGPQRFYVMGEVEIPGDHEWVKGQTVLQAVAQAGGFRNTGKRNNVIVVRRTGPDSADIYQLDLRKALQLDGGAADMPLRPFDIVYVPKTFVANLNVFVDQWMRQNIAPFTLYLEGWTAFHVNSTRTIIR